MLLLLYIFSIYLFLRNICLYSIFIQILCDIYVQRPVFKCISAFQTCESIFSSLRKTCLSFLPAMWIINLPQFLALGFVSYWKGMLSVNIRFRQQVKIIDCILVYRYTKEGNINELRHNSMYGYQNNRNSLVYRYTRTAPDNFPNLTYDFSKVK